MFVGQVWLASECRAMSVLLQVTIEGRAQTAWATCTWRWQVYLQALAQLPHHPVGVVASEVRTEAASWPHQFCAPAEGDPFLCL